MPRLVWDSDSDDERRTAPVRRTGAHSGGAAVLAELGHLRDSVEGLRRQKRKLQGEAAHDEAHRVGELQSELNELKYRNMYVSKELSEVKAREGALKERHAASLGALRGALEAVEAAVTERERDAQLDLEQLRGHLAALRRQMRNRHCAPDSESTRRLLRAVDKAVGSLAARLANGAEAYAEVAAGAAARVVRGSPLRRARAAAPAPAPAPAPVDDIELHTLRADNERLRAELRALKMRQQGLEERAGAADEVPQLQLELVRARAEIAALTERAREAEAVGDELLASRSHSHAKAAAGPAAPLAAASRRSHSPELEAWAWPAPDSRPLGADPESELANLDDEISSLSAQLHELHAASVLHGAPLG